MHADEMFALMDTLGEKGPFLLVAHSFGGLIARTAATADPDGVSGMVLVDAASPLAPDLDQPWDGEGGVIDTSAVPGEVGDGPAMGDEPVIVLQAGIRNESSPLAYTEAEWEAFQRQAATISSNAVYAVVDISDHAIPARNPDAVVAATTAVSQSIRDGNAPLGECPSALAQAGVTCVSSTSPPNR
jgi:pimeloyl-ACP methyl ester carboxylesterase